jgi:hypothetical protein
MALPERVMTSVLRNCRRCQQERPETEFSKSGHICRPCDARRVREWKAGNPDRVRQQKLRYAKKNKEKVAAQARRHYLKDKARRIAANRAWRKKNPEKVRAIQARKDRIAAELIKPRYAKSLLSRMGEGQSRIPFAAIPAELVRAKVAQLQLTRFLKEHT